MAVVIPAGPDDDVGDTVASVRHYLPLASPVVVLDDSGGRADVLALRRAGGPVVVLDPPRGATGRLGGLWRKQAVAYRHVLERSDAEMVLRLDADALIIGAGLGERAAARLARDPRIGVLGGYRRRADGSARGFEDARRILRHETGPAAWRRPAARRTLRDLVTMATRNGYEPGEHALGAVAILRRDLIEDLAARDLLDLPELGEVRLAEDHLTGLLVRALGYRIGEFGCPGEPLAVAWRGLPMSPMQMLAEGRLATHSVRFWEGMDEREIRSLFATVRRAETGRLPRGTALGEEGVG